MIYDIRLVTTYSYAVPAAASRHVVRMLPVDRPGQRILDARLTISPPPAERRDGLDFFGNRESWIAFTEPHRKFELRLTARIAVEMPGTLFRQVTPAWEMIRAQTAASADLSPTSPVQFLFPSRNILLDEEVSAYAAASFTPGRPVLQAAQDLCQRIKADFAYDPEATEVETPLAEAFRLKRGVCQDFAHIMIAGLRGLGIPAAYVSGFLRTLPPPGMPRLEGADATHAWVSVWCGHQIGWIGLDPTNGIYAGEDHIVMAIGRDYADVAPVDGVVIASGGHELTVAVDVTPIVATPA